MSWPVYDAKARFSELLDATLRDGPQVVTRRGVEQAVLVPIDEWKRLNTPLDVGSTEPFVDPLTDPNGPHELYIPPRRVFQRRPPVVFED